MLRVLCIDSVIAYQKMLADLLYDLPARERASGVLIRHLDVVGVGPVFHVVAVVLIAEIASRQFLILVGVEEARHFVIDYD